MTDATALVNWQRTVKSPQELVYIFKATPIVEVMNSGICKNDLVEEIYHYAISVVRSTSGEQGFG